jgi:hypothetical protein
MRPIEIIRELFVSFFISVTVIVRRSKRVPGKDGLFLLLNQHSNPASLTMFSIKITFF